MHATIRDTHKRNEMEIILANGTQSNGRTFVMDNVLLLEITSKSYGKCTLDVFLPRLFLVSVFVF